MINETYLSWGRNFFYPHKIQKPHWLDEVPFFLDGLNSSDLLEQSKKEKKSQILPYGLGRSYGDSCLNENGFLLDTTLLNHVKSFDKNTGVVVCEPGLTIGGLISLGAPFGWFVPVTPGTQFVTLGGAIANDVHGKNHHRRGAFGHFIKRLKLLRSNGEELELNEEKNKDLFYATIGGLGLTGLIVEIEIQLIKKSHVFSAENIKYKNLDEFFELAEESDNTFEYTVAWIDCLAKKNQLGRGIFMRANHSAKEKSYKEQRALLSVPVEMPSLLLSKPTIAMFNKLYYHKLIQKKKAFEVDYKPFLYPLDSIHSWNKLYGKRGLIQYQFVLNPSEKETVRKILQLISDSGFGSFLAVLKKFGAIPSKGLMSFPMEGYTLALDFPNYGPKLKELLAMIDEIVASRGGRTYPAKDSTMRPEHFQKFYPQYREFIKFKDPNFSSSFIRRVTKETLQ